MAGTFMVGERKVRPGSYFNIQKKEKAAAVIMNGVTAVIFRSDFGPLGVRELSAAEGYEAVYGTGMTTDAIREAFAGGAETVIACRAGSGGTPASIVLTEEGGEEEAVTVSAAYPGAKAFTITIREKLPDAEMKQCIIHSGTAEIVKADFPSGEGEASALKEALEASGIFQVKIADGKENAILADQAQKAFTAGTNPAVATEDYADAFAAVEPYAFNTICVDTDDTAVHLLLHEFVSRIFEAGSLVQAVVAEKHTVSLETRTAHAAAFNDEKMHYVLNAHVSKNGTELDGYQTAARIAGMIGAVNAGSSLTHTVIPGFTEILERLTNTQMVIAELQGCLVLSYNQAGKVWIDSAVNTLVTPAEHQDDGWKKIRRVKTRFELIRRMSTVSEELTGKVDNDSNGRKTVVGRLQEVGAAMVEEKKLVSCTVTEDESSAADGDSAWFDVDVVDKDSMEHIYLTFRFQFSTIG